MKIGIDARLINQTGVGRYIRNLIKGLAETDQNNTYILYILQEDWATIPLPGSRWGKKIVPVRWHTLAEQVILPFIYHRDKLDLLHVPYFNAPIGYLGKYILTIHDLIVLHMNTGKASTLPWLLYKIRRIGYHIILKIGLTRSFHILTVSETIKKELLHQCHVSPDKVTVTYEGVDLAFKNSKYPVKYQHTLKSFFLYVGNAYPHKNIESLLVGFDTYIELKRKRKESFAALILIGKSDYFYGRLKKFTTTLKCAPYVHFYGEVSDEVLSMLYKKAHALLIPSLMEGFGLPGLEAVQHACPIIAHDIPIFHEILGDVPIYIDARKSEQITHALLCIGSEARRKKQAIAAFKKTLEQKFSWSTLTRRTLDVYNTVLNE